MYAVKRTSLFLEESLLRRARELARREGRSLAHVVREALAQYLANGPVRKLPSIAGKYRSGYTDTSERAEELLWQDPHD
jgi:hypothetical protein